MEKYNTEIEKHMQRFYLTLPEDEKRRYAAIETLKFRHGGKKYICDLLGCDYQTLMTGLNELKNNIPFDSTRIRKLGGGRKCVLDEQPDINKAFLKIMEKNIAGSPMNEKIKWTNLTRGQIAEKLSKKGFKVSVTVVAQLLKKNHFKRRKAFKTVAGGPSKNRDEPFQKIARLKKEYQSKGNPVLSMDTKKKELIGNFYQNGQLLTTEKINVNDHDLASLADGIAIPHGIYALVLNLGYLTIGTSHD